MDPDSEIEFRFRNLPDAADTVKLEVFVRGDIGQSFEWYTVFLDSTSLGRVASGSQPECATSYKKFTINIPAADFNNAVNNSSLGNRVPILMVGKSVNACVNNDAYLRVTYKSTVGGCDRGRYVSN